MSLSVGMKDQFLHFKIESLYVYIGSIGLFLGWKLTLSEPKGS